jgi:4'-phosphopantetheinyl transferase
MGRRPLPDLGAVHIWRAHLDVAPPLLAELTAALSGEERDRAAHFGSDIHRDRYVTGRGWLRRLLAGYLGVAPTDVLLSRDSTGKPRLLNPSSGELRFNLSHSEGLAVFAVARSREVGIDVEYVRRDFPLELVAERILSAAECQIFATLGAEQKVDTFFAIWTLKEAYFKGLGVGWGTFDSGEQMSLDTLKVPMPEVVQYWTAGRGQWSLAAFDAGVGFAAALAIEGDHVQVPSAARSIEPLFM